MKLPAPDQPQSVIMNCAVDFIVLSQENTHMLNEAPRA